MLRRHRRVLAGVAIVVVALAAVLPGLAGLDCVLVELPWTLAAPLASAQPPLVVPPDEQPLALRSLLPSRAPPTVSV